MRLTVYSGQTKFRTPSCGDKYEDNNKKKRDGSRQYRGVIFVLNYYDEDGDGKFETRYGDHTNVKLPEWSKNK